MDIVRVKQFAIHEFKDSEGRDQEITIYETEGGCYAACDSSFVEQEVVNEQIPQKLLRQLEREGLMAVAFSPFDKNTLMVGKEGEV